ncbi:MAG: S8 family peptidase [Bacteroidetes bacterium]|nr:MAG: S8 family peptidase [Bacteroidota bacterium]UCE70551.1 MAG: S8 family peptidase [Flavobacteriaceae bacterium]
MACENSEEGAVFETLETQNGLSEQWKYEVIPGQYIVTLKEGTLGSQPAAKGASSYKTVMENNKLQLTSLFGKSNLTVDEIKAVYGYTVEGFAAVLNEEQLNILSNDPRVKTIEPDYLIILAPPPGKGPNKDTEEGGGGGSSSQTKPWGIARVNGVANYSGSNKAYILDTGIDLDHEDLNVDATFGWNAFNRGKDGSSLDDGNGHGTHVAGTIAAINNSVGVIGVAAGATVVPVKVLDSRGSGSYSGVIGGVDFVAANGSPGDVANMSLGGPKSTALNSAVEAAASNGIKFSLAAGNERQDANNVSPASANGSNIYTISAMSNGDNWASFSNFGNPPVDYCAPGVAIESTWKEGGYNTISGTSMAAPHAAGILLLGNVRTDGFVSGDRDSAPDPIAVH